MRPAALVLTTALLAAAALATPTTGSPNSVQAGEPDRFAAWARVLAAWVDGEGLVDYAGLKARGMSDLRAFMRVLAATDPSTLRSDDERKAFWMNAYNAVVIWQVIERYPVDSVRDVGALWGLIGGFFKQEYPVAGGEMSPDDIEHETLRATWPDDAEIHWALVCAAFGCPRLRQEPFRAADLDATLDAAGREFLRQPRGLQIDRESRTLYLSSYFDWYEGDFNRVAGHRIDYVLRFAGDDDAAWIRANRDSMRVRIMDYDWTLNDVSNGPRSARPVPR